MHSKAMAQRIEHRKLVELTPHPNNPRLQSEPQFSFQSSRTLAPSCAVTGLRRRERLYMGKRLSYLRPPNRKERRRLQFAGCTPATPMDSQLEAFERAKRDQPTVRLFGQAGLEEYVQTIATVLGPDFACLTEEAFCSSSGCPSQELEAWLKSHWIQHNIHRVERLEEQADAFPIALVAVKYPFYEVRLFSPNPELFDMPAPTVGRPN